MVAPAAASAVVDDGVGYSFAVEYDGPPIPHNLPQAVPINVDKIPVAAVVTRVSLCDKLSLPVAQPILASDVVGRFSKELKIRSQSTISPTSVISFEGRGGSDDDSKELGQAASFVGDGVDLGLGLRERFVSDGGCSVSGELSSSELLNERYGLDCSTELESHCVGDGHSVELLCGVGSSGKLEFSDSFDKSSEVSGGSMAFRVPDGCQKESMNFNDLNQPDWGFNESALSSEYPSSRVSSFHTRNWKSEGTCNERRNPVVTFRDLELEEGDVSEEYTCDEQPATVRVRREPNAKVRKGACYRCLKGYRFTEKEVCIVCDAKYCSNCVLRAMGSMPEGRKCVTCIGWPIEESKRTNLGKCSRMLKKLLNDLEVRQIMKSEKLCAVNQLPPEYVCVNGKPLSHEELAILQSSPNPPKKLKPGNYWYDKVSGLWGKEGEKPSKIISPHLNVGGPVKTDASNGNTKVFINGREITKVELRMLQLAGVQCAGNPHFWVNEDGSYQEEGQKNTKGYIWGKAGTKLVCAVLSLPVPSKSIHSSGEQPSNVLSQTMPDYLEQKTPHKLLLIGYSGSGTSTIFKQAKILYKDIPFTEEERENIKLLIQTNLYGYLGILLEGRECFEDEYLNETREHKSSDNHSQTADDKSSTINIYSICPRLKAFSDWLLNLMVSGNLEDIFPAATREYAPIVEEFWKSTAIQATYRRKSELDMLPNVASYFLERAVDILRIDYIPSDVDILYAEHINSSNGLASVDFSFPLQVSDDTIDTADQHNSLLRFQLIRVQARGFGENCKWVEMFEDVRVIIFCVSLSDYDQFATDGDGDGENKMLLSKKFFELIVAHPTFDQMDFLLILNKFDVFEEKIEQSPLTQCEWFSDFHPHISRHHRSNKSTINSINSTPSLGHMASHYIAVKFKRLYSSLTDRKLYVSVVNGMEPDSVDQSLKYAREILKWDEERPNFSLSEYSIYSTEASSFSP